MREDSEEPLAANTTRERLDVRSRVLITFTFFSMFFGAANLIFPPFLGAQAGSATPLAAVGFIISAVGPAGTRSLLAVSSAGGFEYLADRVSPRFAIVLALAIILTIGPCFAIPRTGRTTSFEMMVVPFTTGIPTWITQLGLFGGVLHPLVPPRAGVRRSFRKPWDGSWGRCCS